MVKNVIVSNRLPIQLSKLENSFDITPSSGGLATGVNSIRDDNSVWIGWSGVKSEEFTTKSNNHIKKILKDQNLIQVELSSVEIENYYYGLSNKSLWPLFHYFIDYSKFNDDHWDTYFQVNKKFCDVVVSNVEKNGTVWVHDYQLMLLPKMIRDIRPDVSIGFSYIFLFHLMRYLGFSLGVKSFLKEFWVPILLDFIPIIMKDIF